MSDFTPTTEEVRETYAASGEGLDFKAVWFERFEEFDRWLAKVKADAIRDVSYGLINWDVIYGHDRGHPQIHRDHETAAWVQKQADAIEKGES